MLLCRPVTVSKEVFKNSIIADRETTEALKKLMNED